MPNNQYMSYDSVNSNNIFNITCPYCFETFRDRDVMFRSKTLYKDSNDMVNKVTNGKWKKENELNFSDDPEAERYRKEVEIHKAFIIKGRSENFQNFWRKYQNGDYPEGERRNGHLEKEIDFEYNRPIIDPKDVKLTSGLRYENDGFLSGMTDICGNLTLSRVCPHCNNPLPHNYGRYPVYHISVIGIKGSGKTVFLSQFLNYLKAECHKIGIVTGVQDPAINRYVDENPVKEGEYLSESTEPEALISPLSINLTIKKQTYTFVFHDIAGENCVSANEKVNFSDFIAHSNALIFIIDPKQIEAFGIPFENGNRTIDLGEVFTTIGATFGGKVGDVPAAVVISQIDRPQCKNIMQEKCPMLYQNHITPIYKNALEAKENPKFNGNEYNNIYDYLDEFLSRDPSIINVGANFPNHSYFGISAIGVNVENAVPVSEPVPHRVSEPFFWILYKLGLLRTSVPVHERITQKEFDQKVRDKASCQNINLQAHGGLFKKKVVNTRYGTVSQADKVLLDNIENDLKQQYIITASDD